MEVKARSGGDTGVVDGVYVVLIVMDETHP